MPKADHQLPRVRLYPTDNFIGGVAAVERMVPAEIADALLAVPSPAFTRDRPGGQDEPTADVREDIDDILREMPDLAPADEHPQSVTSEGGPDA